ncbi:MAG: RAMP superfamily CRISPR-associated protein [Bacteroidales bacterium]|nr:RAMP superfamily CRISPR-associated protein [Bacteroidales bacterium]
MSLTHRYLARVVIEAETPLAVGTGKRDVFTDQLIAKDVNGLPYIPGTALAGILRHSLTTDENYDQINELFGYQAKKSENSVGSRLIISSAMIVNKEGMVMDGLHDSVFIDRFISYFNNLPVRQHVKINENGVAEKHGKFDNQIVFKGTRFCFEMELLTDGIKDNDIWNEIFSTLQSPDFRIGGGTRNGYGSIMVVQIKERQLNLRDSLEIYLEKTSELNDEFWETVEEVELKDYSDQFDTYTLQLVPEDFFLFSSGFSSQHADMTYVTEPVIDWTTSPPSFTESKVLIPASSVKGAIAHRVAFHYNKLNEIYADKIEGGLPKTAENKAVKALFGYLSDDDSGQRGNVLLSDVFVESTQSKLLNHVAIDRFTGGALSGALFNEEVVYGNKETITLEIRVKKDTIDNENGTIIKSFVNALSDICNGLLPLGGGTMRGHGIFTGKLIKNGEEIQL